MSYTYVLKSKQKGTWYIGSTSDLRKRLKQHNDGLSAYTKKDRPWEIIYYEACLLREDSQSREIYLKSGMGRRYIKNRIKRFLSLTG